MSRTEWVIGALVWVVCYWVGRLIASVLHYTGVLT